MRAKNEFGCSPEDLKKLNYLSARNPHHRGFSPMKLYLKTEAKYLGGKRRQEKIQKRQKRDQESIDYKKSKMDKWLGVKFREVDKLIQHFILGDFMSGKNTKMKLRDVKARNRARERVIRILNECPRAHPDAAFQFCLNYPMGGPTEFRELKDKVRAAFRLEGRRIFRYASEKRPYGLVIKDNLRGTPLESDCHEYLQQDASAVVHSHLIKLCDDKTAKEIMQHSVMREFISTSLPEDRVAEKMLKAWRESSARRVELESALHARCLDRYAASYVCERYVYGVDDDLGRVLSKIEEIEDESDWKASWSDY